MESSAAIAYNRRLGLILFFIYCVIYGGFIAIAAAAHKTFALPAVFGVNLAVTYGLSLILLAGVMSAIYLVLAKNETGD